MRSFLFVLIAFPVFTFAEVPGFIPLGGIYYDNLNELNLKVGFAYQYEQVTDKKEIDDEIMDVRLYNSFVYTDFELSESHRLFTVGLGRFGYANNIRLGISYGELKSQRSYGISGAISLLLISFKAGVYKAYTDKPQFMIGAGIGF